MEKQHVETPGLETINHSNLLIVEEELNARNELAELLENHGYIVSRATSGRHAVTKVSKKKGKIDIILMDIKMPGEIDGIEAIRRIRKSYLHIPIILVNACSQSEIYRQRIKESNLKIAGWVDKPIIGENKKKLIQLIETELKKKEVRIEIESKLGRDMSSRSIQSLIEELSSKYRIDLLIEVVKDIEELYPSDKINTGEIFPYLNFTAYENMKDELERNYPGQFVAYLDGEKVGNNSNIDDLIKAVYKERRRTDIFITEIAEEEVIKIRRPMKVIS